MITLRDVLEISHSEISVIDGTCPVITINPRINIDEYYSNKFLGKKIEELYVNSNEQLLVYLDNKEETKRGDKK